MCVSIGSRGTSESRRGVHTVGDPVTVLVTVTVFGVIVMLVVVVEVVEAVVVLVLVTVLMVVGVGPEKGLSRTQ